MRFSAHQHVHYTLDITNLNERQYIPNMQDVTSHPDWTGKKVKLEDHGAVADFQRRYGMPVPLEPDTTDSSKQ